MKSAADRAPLEANEFRISEVPAGSILLVGAATVFNVDSGFCAQASNVHAQTGAAQRRHTRGLNCHMPWHGSQFNVCSGVVLRGPAKDPPKTYRVVVDGHIGRVDVPLASAIQDA